MMFRKATIEDIDQIVKIYEHIHDEIELGNVNIGWIRGVYPTKQTALSAIENQDMFVEEYNGVIVAAAKINQEQVDDYVKASWQYEVNNDQVMVLHTLVVDPHIKSQGYGTRFVSFYEDYALQHGCHYLRIDTNAKNKKARSLYKKLGYQEISIVSSIFNGIPDVQLVCLEKKI